MFFGEKQIVDERVHNAQNQIYREVYKIVVVICWLSIAVKFLTIGVSAELILTELIILIGSSAYYAYRSAKVGLFSDEVEMHDAASKIPYRKKTVLSGVLCGFVIALFMGINSAVNYADSTTQSITYFFAVFAIALLIYAPFFAAFLAIGYYTQKKKSDKVMKNNLEEHDEW